MRADPALRDSPARPAAARGARESSAHPMASIYERPADYDLEHAGPQPDADFFCALARRWRPARIVEYGGGTGRVTRPVAEAAAEWGGRVWGVDASEAMVSAAATETGNLEWCVGDARTWRPPEPVDLIFSACSSLSHLLTEADLLAAWRNAAASLRPGGRFVVAERAPDYATLAESLRVPPRDVIALDRDVDHPGRRLLRCRSARYHAHRQRLSVRFFYDRFDETGPDDRFIDDYEAHVFFPTELRLLFLIAGFEIEAEWGGPGGEPFTHLSRTMIFCGRRPEEPRSPGMDPAPARADSPENKTPDGEPVSRDPQLEDVPEKPAEEGEDTFEKVFLHGRHMGF